MFLLKEADEVTNRGEERIMTAWILWDSNPWGKDQRKVLVLNRSRDRIKGRVGTQNGELVDLIVEGWGTSLWSIKLCHWLMVKSQRCENSFLEMREFSSEVHPVLKSCLRFISLCLKSDQTAKYVIFFFFFKIVFVCLSSGAELVEG